MRTPSLVVIAAAILGIGVVVFLLRGHDVSDPGDFIDRQSAQLSRNPIAPPSVSGARQQRSAQASVSPTESPTSTVDGASAASALAAPKLAAPGQLRDVFEYTERWSSGHLRAVQVFGFSDLFLRLGLLPGDLVIAIGDVSVQDYASGEAVLNSLIQANVSTVTIVRKGKKQDVRVNLDVIGPYGGK